MTDPGHIDRRAQRHERDRRRVRRQRAAALALLAGASLLAALLIGGSSSSPRPQKTGLAPATHRKPQHRGTTTAAQKPPARVIGKPGRRRVPILTYHVIASPPPGAPFPKLYVPVAEFRDQMSALARAGWHGVTLDQVYAYWHRGVPLPPGKPIVLTFDNGYHSQYAAALPVLQKLGWPADENIQLAGLPPSQGGLSSRQVRALVRAGWELDTQGYNHADLITLDDVALRHEVVQSRMELRRRYGVPVNWFCYPSGHYDARVVAMVRAGGYRGSTTTVEGWASRSQDPFRLERIRALGGTSGAQLVALVEAARSAGPPPPSYNGT